MNYMIELKDITKKYKIYQSKKERIIDIISKKNKAHLFTALQNINLSVKKGEKVGIMGVNGSGKSTLLKIISGVTYPTSGNLLVSGRVSSLLELSAGFDENSTGIENIYLKGLLLGLDRAQVNEIMDDVIAFADIGGYINQPVRMYSSGMKARLGFAISIHVNPDILIIDEALSVGDEAFRIKCYHAINHIKRKGATILFVSHSLSQLKSFCDRGIWLKDGKIEAMGEIGEVIFQYREYLKSISQNEEEEEEDKETDEIKTVEDIFCKLGNSVRNKENQKTKVFHLDDEIHVNFTYEIRIPQEFIVVKFYVNSIEGHVIYENNMKDKRYYLNGEVGCFDLRISLNHLHLLPGKYYITALLYDETLFNKIYIVKDLEIKINHYKQNELGDGFLLLEHEIYTKKRV